MEISKKRSLIWTHFEKIPGCRARCEHCLENVSIAGGSTSNLRRHLKNKHPEEKLGGGMGSGTESTIAVGTIDPNYKDVAEFREEDSEVTKSKKRSKIWDYFEIQPHGKPKCQLCGRAVSISNGSTGNLRRHLKLKHSDEVQDDKDQNGELSESGSIENSTPSKTDEVITEYEGKKRKRSLVWVHFKEIGPGRARCEYCSKFVSFKLGSTGNLVRHLRTQHHRIVNKNLQLIDSGDPVSGDPILINLGVDDNFQSEYIEVPEIEKRGLYDLCIIGGGLIGSAAARHASANPALNVVLVGPDESNKDGRKCAKPFCSYHEEENVLTLIDELPPLQKLIERSSRQLKELEKISGKMFYFSRKTLVFGKSGHPGVEQVKGIMTQRSVGASDHVSNSSDLSSRYPYLHPTSEDVGISDEANSGYINERSLKEAQLKVAQIQGCEIVHDIVKEVSPVKKLGQSYCHKVVLENRYSIFTKRVLICTGAFTKFKCLIPDRQDAVPLLNVRKETAALFEIPAEEAEQLRDMPVIKYFDPLTPTSVYILPPVLVPDFNPTNLYYIKVCGNMEELGDSLVNTVEDISEWYQSDGSEKSLQKLLGFLTSALPGIAAQSVKSSPYIVCQTASSLPYIDRLTPTVTVAVGGGAKCAAFSDEIGRLAAELSIYGRWESEVPQSLFNVIWQM